MKILIVTLRGPTNLNRRGGSQDYIFHIAKRWVNSGYTVTILSGQELLNGELLPNEEMVSGVAIQRVGTPRIRVVPIVKTARTYFSDADVVIENIMGFPFLLPILLKRTNNLVAIRHHFEGANFIKGHGLIKGAYGLFLENIVQPLIYRNTPFAVVSKKTEMELNSKWIKPKGRITIIPPGIDGNFFGKHNQPARACNPTVLYLGALDIGRKKVDHLIKAFRSVVKIVPHAKLIIGGNGPDKEYLQKAAIGLPIQFVGFVSDEEKRHLFATSWVFASPSTSEGFGITWVEANAYGLPVVGYELGLDTVNPTCARMVAPGDVAALAMALIELLSDDKKREEMEQAAYLNSNRFSWDLSSARLLKFVEV